MYKHLTIEPTCIDYVYDIDYDHLGYYIGYWGYWDGILTFRMDGRDENNRISKRRGVVGLNPIMEINIRMGFYGI